jgi:hypothetical protein
MSSMVYLFYSNYTFESFVLVLFAVNHSIIPLPLSGNIPELLGSRKKMEMILCLGERTYFPENEFVQDQDKNLIHKVEEEGVKYWHYQSTGDPVEPKGVTPPETFTETNEPPEHLTGPSASNPYQNPDVAWPSYPPKPSEGGEYVKILTDAVGRRYQSELDDLKAAQDAIRQSINDAQGNDYTSLQAINSAYLDVAKGQIDRSQARATQVVTAAGAIGTIYTAILALRFNSSGSSGTVSLALTAIIPAIFLGAAIVFAVIYLAYITPQSRSVKIAKPSGIASFRVQEQRDNFIKWANAIVHRRLSSLHAAAISLGFGVVFLPVAFLTISPTSERYVWIAAILAVAIEAAIVFLLRSSPDSSQSNSV